MESNPILRLARLLESKKSGAAQIQIPDALDKDIAKLIATQRTCKADKLEALVKVLGERDGAIVARLATRAFILIFAILRAAEPCAAQHKGLVLLADSFSKEVHAFSATQLSQTGGPSSTWISRKKARLGEQLLEKALQQFCNEDVNILTRRWMGILALELIHDCEENQQLLQLQTLAKRMKLSQLALSGEYPVIQFVALRILRTMITAGAHPNLFDSSGTNGVIFSDFNTSKALNFESALGYHAWLQETDELLPHTNCLSGVIFIETILVETAPTESKYLQASREGLLMCGAGTITLVSIVDGQDTFMDVPLDAIDACDLTTGQPGTLHSARLQLNAPISVNARSFSVTQIALQMADAKHLETIQTLLSPLKHQVVIPAQEPSRRQVTPDLREAEASFFTPLAVRTRQLCVAAKSPMDVGQHIHDRQFEEEDESEALRVSQEMMQDIVFEEISQRRDATQMVKDSQATEATILALSQPRTTRSGKPINDPLSEDELAVLSADAFALVNTNSPRNTTAIIDASSATAAFAQDKRLASKALAKETPQSQKKATKLPQNSARPSIREIDRDSNSVFDIESSEDERPAPKAPQKPKSVPKKKAKAAQKPNTKAKRSPDVEPPDTPVPQRNQTTKRSAPNLTENVENTSRPTRRAAQVATEKIKGMSNMSRLHTQNFFSQQRKQAEAEITVPPNKNPRDQTNSPSRNGSVLESAEKKQVRPLSVKRKSPKASPKKVTAKPKESRRKITTTHDFDAYNSDVILLGDDESPAQQLQGTEPAKVSTAKPVAPDIAILPATAPSPSGIQPRRNIVSITPQMSVQPKKNGRSSAKKTVRKPDPVAEKLKSALACLLSPQLMANTNQHAYSVTLSPAQSAAAIFSPAQAPSSIVHKTSTPLVAVNKTKLAVPKPAQDHDVDDSVEIISDHDVGSARAESPRPAPSVQEASKTTTAESVRSAALELEAAKPPSATKPWLLSKDAQTASARKKAELRSSEKKRHAVVAKKIPPANVSAASPAKKQPAASQPRRPQLRVTQEGSPLPREPTDDAPRLSLFIDPPEALREPSVILADEFPILVDEVEAQEEMRVPEQIDMPATTLSPARVPSADPTIISSDELAETSPDLYEATPPPAQSSLKNNRATPHKSARKAVVPKVQMPQSTQKRETNKRKSYVEGETSETSTTDTDELSGGMTFEAVVDKMNASDQKKRRVHYKPVEIDDSQQESDTVPITKRSKKAAPRTRPAKPRHVSDKHVAGSRKESSTTMLEDLLSDLNLEITRQFEAQEQRARDKLYNFKMRELAALQRRADERAAQHEYWVKSANQAKTEIVRDLQKLDHAIAHKWKKNRKVDLTESYNALTASREAIETVFPEIMAGFA